MKKFLSLVLALVMTMSLVTISAGAKDFTDDESIQYAEAIDVMSAIGVIDGYTDGSFKPTNQLNRGQAAKILCNMILGPTTAKALKADAAPFKDVPADSTFAAYITYCSKAGIIDGYTDGTFRPTAPLTGYAFMKLLLGALGYDKDVEGYNQPNWSINVAKQALGIGLDKGLTGDFDGTKIVTREEACLYALNTLKATMVEYEAKTNISVGGAEVVIAGSKAKEVEQGSYKSYTGASAATDKTLQFCEKYFKDLTKTGASDAFDRPATTWKVKNNEVGTYTNKGMLVFKSEKKVTKADVYAALGKSVVDDLVDGKSTLKVSIDGVDTIVNKNAVSTTYASKNDSGKVNSTGNGSVTEIYVDTDTNNVWIITINTYVFQAVSDYNSKKESIEIVSASDNTKVLNDRTLELEDFPGIADLKADDYLLVTNAEADNGKFDVKSVEKAEILTGNVAGYKVTDSVELDGTSYEYSNTADATTKGTLYTVGQEAAVVLDTYGHIIAIDKAVVAKNYVFVSQFGSTSALNSNAVANAFFTDGTSEEITIKEAINKTAGNARVTDKGTISGWNIAYDSHTGWFTYSKNANGQYNLYAIPSTSLEIDTDSTVDYTDDGNAANDVITVNNKVSFLGSGVTLKDAGGNTKTTAADDDTIIVLKDNKGNVSAFTGVKNIPDITLKKGVSGGADGQARVSVVNGKNGYADYVFVHVTGAVSISGGADTEMVYVRSYDGEHRTTDNVQYWTYNTLVDGKKETVQADSKNVAGTGKVYDVYFKARSDADSRLTQLDQINGGAQGSDGRFYYDNSSSATITYSAGALTIGDASPNTYTLAKDAKITLVTLGEISSLSADARALNKDKDAEFEVADGISGKVLADTLKGYTYTYRFAMKTTEAGGSIIEQLIVTVVTASETVAPSDDASITSLKVKGVDATWNATTEQYEILLPVVNNDVVTQRVTITAAAGATAVITSSFTNNTSKFSSSSNTITIKVTAADTTTIENYTLVITLEDIPALTTSATAAHVIIVDPVISGDSITPGKVRTKASSKATDTVADVMATLSVGSGYSIEAVKPGALGGTLPADDTDKMNTSGLAFVVTCEATGTEFTYTVDPTI